MCSDTDSWLSMETNRQSNRWTSASCKVHFHYVNEGLTWFRFHLMSAEFIDDRSMFSEHCIVSNQERTKNLKDLLQVE